jgi:hypothetical protein
MRPSFPCGPNATTIPVMEEEEEGEFVEFTLAMTNDLDTDTAVVIQMAALMRWRSRCLMSGRLWSWPPPSLPPWLST